MPPLSMVNTRSSAQRPVTAVGTVKLGDGSRPDTQMGPLNNPAQCG